MRISTIAVLACTLAAACSPPAPAPAPADTSANSPAAGGTIAGSIQPGQYRTTVTVLDMNIPGIKTSTINMAPTTTEDCVTSSDVSEFTRGGLVDADEGETCTQNSMNSTGGHIEGSATCQGENGPRTMHISGAYTSNHVEMDVTASSQMPGGGGEMTQRMRIVTDRIGECAAGESTN